MVDIHILKITDEEAVDDVTEEAVTEGYSD